MEIEELPPNPKYKTEWWFDDDHGEKFRYLLKVDEESSVDELEDEMEFWLTEIKMYDIDGAHKKAIMDAVKWMMMLAAQ